MRPRGRLMYMLRGSARNSGRVFGLPPWRLLEIAVSIRVRRKRVEGGGDTYVRGDDRILFRRRRLRRRGGVGWSWSRLELD